MQTVALIQRMNSSSKNRIMSFLQGSYISLYYFHKAYPVLHLAHIIQQPTEELNKSI